MIRRFVCHHLPPGPGILAWAALCGWLLCAPFAGAAEPVGSIPEDIAAASNPGTPVSDLLARLAGTDAGRRGIAVTGADSANGVWEYSVDGGLGWLVLAGASPTEARLLAGGSGADHGASQWHCFVSASATYSITDPNGGTIYDEGSNVVVSATGPARGVIQMTAGKQYFGSVPINLVAEDNQHAVAPLSMKGTQFWNYSTRNAPTTYYVYSPDPATVRFFNNVAAGLFGTPTETVTLAAGGTWQFSGNLLNSAVMISADSPIVVTATGNGADRTVLSPMDRYVYNRYLLHAGTEANSTPSVRGNYVVYDSTYPVMSTTIADGSGLDTAQGLGLSQLSTGYSWGNTLSDYVVVAPNGDTEVSVHYWSAEGWVLLERHALAGGTREDPVFVQRDGTVGPGNAGSNINGSAGNLGGGSTLWKWEGTQPFYLGINDSADDEFSVLGWAEGGGARVRFVPNANFTGTATITFRTWDLSSGVSGGTADVTEPAGAGAFSVETAASSIEITPVNDAPVAVAQAVTTLEDTAVGVTLVGSDVDGDALVYTVVTGPTKGSLSGTAPQLTYTPNPDATGTDTFTFRVHDGTADSAVATVSIEITPVNDAPALLASTVTLSPAGVVEVAANGEVAWEESAAVPEGVRVMAVSLGLDYSTYWDWDAISGCYVKLNGSNVGAFVWTALGTGGAWAPVSLRADGAPVGYAPGSPNVWTLGSAWNPTSVRNLRVTVLHEAANGEFLTVNTPEGVVVHFSREQFMARFWDPEGASLASVTVMSLPSGGRLKRGGVPVLQGEVISAADLDALEFEPAAGVSGPCSFAVTAMDGAVSSAPATVRIDVTPATRLGLVQEPAAAAGPGLLSRQPVVALLDGQGAATASGGWIRAAIAPGSAGVLSGSVNILAEAGLARFTDLSVTGVPPGEEVRLRFTAGFAGTSTGGEVEWAYAVRNGLGPGQSLFAIDRREFEGAAAPASEVTWIQLLGLYAGPVSYLGEDQWWVRFAIESSLDGAEATPEVRQGGDFLFFRAEFGFSERLAATDSAGFRVPLPPTLAAVSKGGGEDSPVPFGAADFAAPAYFHPEGAALDSIIVASLPERGVLLLAQVPVVAGQRIPAGDLDQLSYLPEPDAYGPVTFSVAASDGVLSSAPATVNIQIDPANDRPTVAAITDVELAEDTASGVIGFSVGDVETAAVELAVTAVSSNPEVVAAVGIVLGGDGPDRTIQLIPAANASGTSIITVTVLDAEGGDASTSFVATVTPANDAPVAVAQGVTTLEDTAVGVTLVGSDVDGDALGYTVVTGPAKGSLSGTAPQLTYTPDADAHGTDSFTFRVNDGTADSAVATVSIEITPANDAPVAVAQGVTTMEDTAVGVTLVGSDVDGDELGYTVVTGPTKGSLSGTAPDLVYTPDADAHGTDSFTFRVHDGTADSAVATVSIEITPVNDAPTLVASRITLRRTEELQVSGNGEVTLTETAPVPAGARIAGVKLELEYSTYWNWDAVSGCYVNLNGTAVGSLGWTGLGTGGAWLPVALEMATPPATYAAGNSNLWTIGSAWNPTSLRGIQLTVHYVDPEGVFLSVSGSEDVPVQFSRGQFAGAFRDREGATLAGVTVVTPPGAGRLKLGLDPVVAGTVIDAADLDRLVYEPEGNATGTVTFTMTASDGELSSAPATVSIWITPVNDPPTLAAVADQSVAEGTALSLTLVGSDSDLPAQTLGYRLVSGPAGMTVTAAGQLAWTPTEAQGPSTNAVTVAVSDGALEAQQTFTVVVTEVNAAPTLAAVADQSVAEGTALSLTLVGSDFDLPAQMLGYRLVSGPAGMTVTAAGQLAWTPTEAQGPSTNAVTVAVGDGALEAQQTFTVVVTELNVAPAWDFLGNRSVAEGSELEVTLVARDADFPAQTLGYTLVSGPVGMAVSAAGRLSWTPSEVQGPSTNAVTVAVSDGEISVETQFLVIVSEVNRAPVLSAIADQTVAEGDSLRLSLGTRLLANFNAEVSTYVGTGPATETRYRAFGRGNYFYSSEGEFGDQLVLGPGAGQVIASFKFEYYANYAADRGLIFRIYASDGPGDTPGTMLDRRELNVRNGGGIVTIHFDHDAANILPQTFIYTVQFAGAGGFNIGGLIAGNEEPSAGASLNDFWEKVDGVWVNRRLSLSSGSGAEDPDWPAASLTYRLVNGPAGMVVTSDGELAWTPTEVQGPSTNLVTVAVSDGELSAEQSFTVVVTEVNSAPTLAIIGDQTVAEGSVLNLTLLGTDRDLPAQSLTYSLVSGPAGMTVTSAGRLSWRPTEIQAPSENLVTVAVDDGDLREEHRFSVIVLAVERPLQLAGKAVDGYLSGSLVFFDADLDGWQDGEEPAAVTDRQGNFELKVDLARFDRNGNGVPDETEGRLVLSGGIDLSTGAALAGTLTAPAGSTVITPLTTLVETLIRSGTAATVSEAEQTVREALGLPDVKLTAFDALAAARTGDLRAAAVQAAAAQVSDTVRQIAVLLGVSGGEAAVSAALAGSLVEGMPVTLSDAATLAGLIDRAAARTGSQISEAVKASAATVMAAGNALKMAAASTADPVAAIGQISQAQTLAQGEVPEALAALKAGRIGADDAILRLTGDSLAAAVQSAPLGDLFGELVQPGTFELSGTAAVVLESGVSLKPLGVVRRDGAAGSVRVELRFTPAAGLLQDRLVLEFADGEIRKTADLGLVIVDDTLPGSGLELSVSLQLVDGSPAGAVLGSRTVGELLVIDNDSTGSVGFAATDPTVPEHLATSVPVILERSGGSAGRILTQVKLSGGTATPGEDYFVEPITVEFGPGEMRRRVFLPLVDDALPEPDESLGLTLELLPGSAAGAAIRAGASAVTAKLQSDDPWLIRHVPAHYRAHQRLGILLSAEETLPAGWSLKETLPEGWKPDPVPAGATWDAVNRILTWHHQPSPFGGLLSYWVVASGEASIAKFAGVTVLAEGGQAPVGGASEIPLAPAGSGTVTRKLPASFTSGETVEVQLLVWPDSGTDQWSVSDSWPHGWTLVDAGTGLAAQAGTRTVAASFRGGTARTLRYWLRAPAAVSGPAKFSGEAWFDGEPTQVDGPATVAWNRPPQPRFEAAVGMEDTSLSVALPQQDDDGDPLTWRVVSVEGVVQGADLKSTDTLLIRLIPDASGEGRVNLLASDGRFEVAATLPVRATPANDAPRPAPVSAEGVEDELLELQLMAQDPEGDWVEYRLSTPPLHGRLDISPLGRVRYLPGPDFSGEDRFGWVASDQSDDSDESIAKIVIREVADAPRPRPDTVRGREGTTIGLSSEALVSNDESPDGSTLWIDRWAPTSAGNLVQSEGKGNWTFTPPSGFNGELVLQCWVTDGRREAPSVVRVELAPEDGAPVAGEDLLERTFGSTLEFLEQELIANDSAEVGSVHIVAVSPLSRNGGRLQLSESGSITLSPVAAFSEDSMRYQIRDSAGRKAWGTAVIRLRAAAGHLDVPEQLKPGSLHVRASGTPSATYLIESAEVVGGTYRSGSEIQMDSSGKAVIEMAGAGLGGFVRLRARPLDGETPSLSIINPPEQGQLHLRIRGLPGTAMRIIGIRPEYMSEFTLGSVVLPVSGSAAVCLVWSSDHLLVRAENILETGK